jgi:hypothetical protein
MQTLETGPGPSKRPSTGVPERLGRRQGGTSSSPPRIDDSNSQSLCEDREMIQIRCILRAWAGSGMGSTAQSRS